MFTQIFQYLLIGCLVGMALLAAFYLRGRRLSLMATSPGGWWPC